MSKIIKVVVSTEIEVPDNAELIRIKDDDGNEREYIRVAGKLAIPAIHWMEYLSSARMQEKWKEMTSVADSTTGMGFVSLDEDFCEDCLKAWEGEKYYFEEKA